MRDPLAARFAAWRSSQRKAVIPYITAGYPTPAATLDLMQRFARAGADIIELGVPFSDPVADGPTIQLASQRALEQGTTLSWTLEQLRAFRQHHDTAVVIFSYLNPVLEYGIDRFIADAVAAGAQGVLFTDLPLGGDDAIETAIEQSPLALIRLIAPTTEPDRARMIARRAQGFVYYIARMGVTGSRTQLPANLVAELNALRATTDIPICVGFGISTPEHAAVVAAAADGIVIGSALIEAVHDGGAEAAEKLVRAIRTAI